MKTKLFFTVLLIFGALNVQADPDNTKSPDFDELSMMQVAAENCAKVGVSGYSGAAVRIAIHPVSFATLLKNMIANRDGETWTDNYIDFDYTKKLHAVVKERIEKDPSCYTSTGEALDYTVMGGKIQNYINNFILGRRMTGEYEGLPQDLYDLSNACSKELGFTNEQPGDFEQVAAYYKPKISALTKHPVLLADDKLAEVENDAMREMIRAAKPSSCQDISKLREEMISDFAKIELYIRFLLKADGLPVP